MATRYHISLVDEAPEGYPIPENLISVDFPEGEIYVADGTTYTTDDRVLAESAHSHPWLQTEAEVYETEEEQKAREAAEAEVDEAPEPTTPTIASPVFAGPEEPAHVGGEHSGVANQVQETE